MAAVDARTSIYFETNLCKTLCDTIDHLISDRRIEPQIGAKIMQHFTSSFKRVFEKEVTNKITLKGHLDYYRNCDETWLWKVSNCTIQMGNEKIHVDRLRIAGHPTEVAKMRKKKGGGRTQMQAKK